MLVVGSCRVFRPLRAADDAGLIRLVNKADNWWFTHSPAGAAQYVDALAGTRDVPVELRPLVCETMIERLPTDLMARHMLDVDAVVVEVSTLRQLTIGDTHLNHQMVWGHLNRLGVTPGPVLWGNAAAVPDGDTVKAMRVGRATRESTVAALRHIRDVVGAPLVTVDHLRAQMPDGGVAAERLDITALLADLDDFPTWSTGVHIGEAGQSALEDQNHWAKSAELPVGRLLAEAVLAVSHEVVDH